MREQGRPQDLAGGQEFFFVRFGNFAMRFARGFGGMLPRKLSLKWCNLVRFGVYFDQILYFKKFKNCHLIKFNALSESCFYITFFKILIFYIKEEIF